MIGLRLWPLALWLAAGACGPRPAPSLGPQASQPPMLLGEFEDDYGSRYTITPSEWFQLPRARYHILHWRTSEQYLIARNDSANPSDPLLWTRIDWLPLDSMPPYTWAFCLSAYNAPTAAAAESTHVAKRDTPRTGCNGFPFSRMRRPAETGRTPSGPTR